MSRIGNFTETMGEQNKDEPKINFFLYRVIWRKYTPFIPILGIPLTFYFHKKYGDTVIKNDNHFKYKK